MFRTWEVTCSSLLKEGNNTLKVHFESAVKKGKEASKNLPYTLPGEEKVFTRKAAYHYGWDWGPRFVTCGIWQPVKLLLQKGNLAVSNYQFLQKELLDQQASLVLSTSITSLAVSPITIQVYDDLTNQLLGSSRHEILSSEILKTNFTIKNPKRWWCNGYGDQYLYSIRIDITHTQTGEKISKKKSLGLRTIELIQEPDSLGKSFYFKLNGQAVFMKGANYIPPDNFLPRQSPANYYKLVQHAVDANMNMLRVWGGGVYADNAFYEACDKKGILVWQDFMFANAMYPGDETFLQNIKKEAEQQITRLRDYTCIALWCGNNEISEAWHNWGWQKQYNYSKSDSTLIWYNYLQLFENLLPQQVNKLDSSRAYWPSSPQHGWGRKKSMEEGDSHYWGVWWGKQPFSIYEKKVGRFMSEYGFQGMPSAHIFKKIKGEEELTLQSPVVLHHQKHPIGFETINQYMETLFKQPKRFEHYRYLSQLVQAEGMRISIEAHRRNQPACMGSLYWQLNDCWPVTSWSSIDAIGIPKAANYAIQKAFGKAITSIAHDENSYSVYVIADQPASYTLKTRLVNFEGKLFKSNEKTITITNASSVLAMRLDSLELVSSQNPKELVFTTQLEDESGHLVYQGYYYFLPVKELQLTKPILTWRIDTREKILELSTNTLTKNVFIEAGVESFFTENFFDLLPNQKKLIPFTTELSLKKLKQKLVINSVYDTLEP